jgi:hypothetical protein
MPLPESFLQHLRDEGYHPRSDKHSHAMAAAIVQDLMQSCRPLAERAAAGEVVYDMDMHLRFRTADWKSDLVLGTPLRPIDTMGASIATATPATVQIGVEIKGIMTEHRKAVKNRKRDFEAHHEHVHNYSGDAIAGGVMVVNAALSFRSPLRIEPTVHGDRAAVQRLIEHCITEMRNVAESHGSGSHGMDAKTAVVVEFDNIDLSAAKYVSRAPAPQPGDPLHYDSFIQKLCNEYTRRFM